jgi:hypothetical protein
MAADLLDTGNMSRYLAAFKRKAKGSPRLWGLHNYGDVNRRRTTYTKRLLRSVPGEVWLTETGGIVRFGSRYRGGKRGEAHAASAVKRTFDIARSSSRIKRVYLYHWDADRKFVTWDSAFIAANGRARPALEVLRSEINRQRRGHAPALPKLAKYPHKKLPLF